MARPVKNTEIITVYGETDGSNTTGVFTLTSEAFTNTVQYLRFDKGVKAKIWAKHISGAPVTLVIEYTSDVTATSPVWTAIDKESMPDADIVAVEKRKPRIIYFRTGREAIRFSWEQSTAGKSYVAVYIEVEPEEYG